MKYAQSCNFFLENYEKFAFETAKKLNAGILYIYGIRKREHITPYRSTLQWLTMHGRRDYFTAVLLYRIFTSGKPAYLVGRYIANESSCPVRRYKQPLCIPAFQRQFLRSSFYVISSYLWNSLPLVIRECDTIKAFKSCIHSYLFSLEVGQTSLLQAHLQ